MTNLEIKININDPASLKRNLLRMKAMYCYKMHQIDTYFETGENKVKLREIDKKELQLIEYFRKEIKGKKTSFYTIKNINQKSKKELFKTKNPLCVIDKIRELWMYKNTRIHLDKVKGLGKFLELETVLKDISKKEGEKEFNQLIKILNIDKNNSIPSSYSDLLVKK